MAQEHKAVIRFDAWWIVRELKRWDRPGVYAGASQEVLTDECAVVAGSGTDDEKARPAR